METSSDEDEPRPYEPWKEDIVRELSAHNTQHRGGSISSSGPPAPAALRGSYTAGGDHQDRGNDQCFELYLDKARITKLFRTLYPWIFTVLLGFVVALNGAFITHNADWFADFRFGVCYSAHYLVLADRKRCCGGIDNYDESEDRCITPAEVYRDPSSQVAADVQQWYAWEELAVASSRSSSWIGWLAAFLVYCGSSVLFTAICCLIVFEFAPQAKGSGIPEVKAHVSGFDLKQSFSPMTLLLKSVGLSLVVGAGLALGKEGPLIQVGVCWAHILGNLKGIPFLGSNRYTRFFRDEQDVINVPLYEWSFVGAAVGVSTAFGAPLGGVLFAVEELGSVRTITRRALLLCFLGAFAASFTLKFLNITGSNNVTMFSLSTASNSFRKEWGVNEIWLFLLLGVLGGVLSGLFIRMNLFVARERKRKKQDHGTLWFLTRDQHEWILSYLLPERFVRKIRERGSQYRLSSRALVVVEGVFIAVCTSVTNYIFTRLLKSHSTVAIHALFETCPHSKGLHFALCNDKNTFNASFSMNGQLLLAAGIRLLQTVITFGAMLPSGLFIPSLFIGATVGRLVGNISYLVVLEQHIEPGVFAMIGAAAMLAGFTRMTVSLVVIMFELTGELTYVIPFMCAVITAKVVGDLFTGSIYEEHATLNGFANIEDTPTSIRLEVLVADLASEYPWTKVLDVDQYFRFAALRDMVGLEPATLCADADQHDEDPTHVIELDEGEDEIGNNSAGGAEIKPTPTSSSQLTVFEPDYVGPNVVLEDGTTTKGHSSSGSPQAVLNINNSSARKTKKKKRRKLLAENPFRSSDDEDDSGGDDLKRDRDRLLRRSKEGAPEMKLHYAARSRTTAGGGGGPRGSNLHTTTERNHRKSEQDSVILVRRGVGPIFGYIRKRRLRQWLIEMMRVEDNKLLEERYCCFALFGGDGLWAENMDVRAQTFHTGGAVVEVSSGSLAALKTAARQGQAVLGVPSPMTMRGDQNLASGGVPQTTSSTLIQPPEVGLAGATGTTSTTGTTTSTTFSAAQPQQAADVVDAASTTLGFQEVIGKRSVDFPSRTGRSPNISGTNILSTSPQEQIELTTVLNNASTTSPSKAVHPGSGSDDNFHMISSSRDGAHSKNSSSSTSSYGASSNDFNDPVVAAMGTTGGNHAVKSSSSTSPGGRATNKNHGSYYLDNSRSSDAHGVAGADKKSRESPTTQQLDRRIIVLPADRLPANESDDPTPIAGENRGRVRLPTQTGSAGDENNVGASNHIVDIELADDEVIAEDVSFLVDTHLARLSMDAHILTLFCVFHQNPSLRYVVCSSNQGRKLGLVSRSAFVRALCDHNFAQPPIHLGIDEEVSGGSNTQCLPFYFGTQAGLPGVPTMPSSTRSSFASRV
ncbi:unnamed protein product [Amoebophrya sp. A120]|nr:unnamed protein product [Amoebophrya sp. A120]|eukprot:GSA120T00010869001.1